MGWVQACSELTVEGTISWIQVGLQFYRRLAWSMVAQYDKEEQLFFQSIVTTGISSDWSFDIGR